MWIVKVALHRPYTFIVFALLTVLLGVFSIFRMPTDIFPNIPIPVVATVWAYTGLLPAEMANRLILFTERTAQTAVNNVEHTESQSLFGVGVVGLALAFVTTRAAAISTFLRVFSKLFAAEFMLLALAYAASSRGFWPGFLAEAMPPSLSTAMPGASVPSNGPGTVTTGTPSARMRAIVSASA